MFQPLKDRRAALGEFARRMTLFFVPFVSLCWKFCSARILNAKNLNTKTQRAQRRVVGISRAFVLLEVLVSLTILTVTVTAILRSFSQSLSAVRKIEVETQAVFFAQQLLDEFEINPPEEGKSEGGFGDDYWQYSYKVDVEYTTPEYDDLNKHEEVSQFFPFRSMKIEIYYNNGVNQPIRAIAFDSAIMGFERFSHESKLQTANF